MAQPAGREHQKRNHELHKEQKSHRPTMKPARKLKDVPGQGRRQWLSFIMYGQGREMTPGQIAAGQLDGSGKKNKAA